MKFLPRKENRAERKVKAFKATENSTGKHQSAMDAIGRAVGNTDSLMEGILGEHERAGARAHSKWKTRASFAGEQPSHVEVRTTESRPKGIPIGVSDEVVAALQNPNWERPFRGNHTTDEDTK